VPTLSSVTTIVVTLFVIALPPIVVITVLLWLVVLVLVLVLVLVVVGGSW
jgi:hypothetical protein